MTHDPNCFMHDHSFDEYLMEVDANIMKHGQHLVGVLASEDGPGFTYTIGLSSWVGYELFVYSLPPSIAAPILNDIGHHLRAGAALAFDVPDDRFSNLPLKFVQCGPRAQDVNGIAQRHYKTDHVPMVQVVLSDRHGRFPEEKGFDHDYMDGLQPLLYDR